MISGTFVEWVDAGTPGEWSHHHTDGAKCRVSIALVTREHENGGEEECEVYEMYCEHTVAPELPIYFDDSIEVVKSGHVTWETPGEVING